MENYDTYKRIGAHLKYERIEKQGLSQEDAALEFYVDTKTWQRYEQGKILPPTLFLLNLHQKWGTDLTWLLTDATFTEYKKHSKRKESVHKGSVYGVKSERPNYT